MEGLEQRFIQLNLLIGTIARDVGTKTPPILQRFQRQIIDYVDPTPTGPVPKQMHYEEYDKLGWGKAEFLTFERLKTEPQFAGLTAELKRSFNGNSNIDNILSQATCSLPIGLQAGNGTYPSSRNYFSRL
jgi:hypothetical protein